MPGYTTYGMDTPRTKPCPACGACDPDCLICGGAGAVPAVLDLCPNCGGGEPCHLCGGTCLIDPSTYVACPGCASDCSAYHRTTCPHCDGCGYVLEADEQHVIDALDDEAYVERMERSGLHWSGVPFSGEF